MARRNTDLVDSSSDHSSEDFTKFREIVVKSMSPNGKGPTPKGKVANPNFKISQVTIKCDINPNIERTNSAFDSDDDSSEYYNY